MVRRHQSLTPRAKLKIVIGNPLKADELAQGLPNHNAVISYLGQRSKAGAKLLRMPPHAEAMTRVRVRR
jgi:hypothetical protein